MLLLLLFSFVISISYQISYIPESSAKSSVLCEIPFTEPVREFYPDYQIVTGQKFLAVLDIPSCSVAFKQVRKDSPCTTDSDCQDHATSVIKLGDSTYYYCYTSGDQSPQPMTLTYKSDGSVTDVKEEGISDICVYDASKSSKLKLSSDKQTIYIATDSDYSDQSGFKYYNIAKNSVLQPNMNRDANKIIGMFERDEFLYIVYQDRKNSRVSSRVSRVCLSDAASGNALLNTLMAAKIECQNTINGIEVVLDIVLSVEYSSELDKLFILSTQSPVSSSAVALCVVDVAADVNTFFDNTEYLTLDESGKTVKKTESPVKCTDNHQFAVLWDAVDTITTSNVILTSSDTEMSSFVIYKSSDHHLFYFLAGPTLHVYDYRADRMVELAEVRLGLSSTSISVKDDVLYLTSAHSVRVSNPYWCQNYGTDPVSCIASMHPSCAFSKAENKCISTTECLPEKCVQELDTGSFSSVFPEGYTFTIRGGDCQGGVFYTDKTYSYQANGTLQITLAYRDCETDQPVTGAPILDGAVLTDLETGLVVAVVVLSLVVGVLVVSCFRGRHRLSKKKPPEKSSTVITNADRDCDKTTPVCNVLSVQNAYKDKGADDRRKIMATPTPTLEHSNVDPMSFRELTSSDRSKSKNINNKQANGHELIYKNPSAPHDMDQDENTPPV